MLPVRKKMRLQSWDYSEEGTYFLTLCAKNRKPIFSEIVGRGILDAPETCLYRYGAYIRETIEFIAEHNPQIVIHNWVIMPNHVHILLSLRPEEQQGSGASGMPRPTDAQIPKLVSSLKRFTNRRAGTDLWQTSYYDHIIRDEQDFLKRWQYIDNNPAAWLEDEYYFSESI